MAESCIEYSMTQMVKPMTILLNWKVENSIGIVSLKANLEDMVYIKV